MHKFLVKYYPVYPAQMIEVYQLDVLDCENYCSKNHQEFVRNMLEEYNCELNRHTPPSIFNGILRCNNSTWSIEECWNADTAIKMHMIKLKRGRNKKWGT